MEYKWLCLCGLWQYDKDDCDKCGRNIDELKRKEISDLWEYVARNGFWFASNGEQKAAAEQLCDEGKLRRVKDIVTEGGENFYVPAVIQSETALPHGLYRHLVLGVPC